MLWTGIAFFALLLVGHVSALTCSNSSFLYNPSDTFCTSCYAGPSSWSGSAAGVATCSTYGSYLACPLASSISSTTSASISHSCGTPQAQDVLYDVCKSRVFIACYGTGLIYRYVDPNTAALGTGWTTVPNINSANQFINARYMEIDTIRGLLYVADDTYGLQALNLTQLYLTPSAPTFFNVYPSSVCAQASSMQYDPYSDVLYVVCSNNAVAPYALVSILHPRLGTSAPRQTAISTCNQPLAMELYGDNTMLMLACRSSGSGSSLLYMVSLDQAGGMTLQLSWSLNNQGAGSNCVGLGGFSFYGYQNASGPNSLYVLCVDSGNAQHNEMAYLIGSTSAATLTVGNSPLSVTCNAGNSFGRYDQGIGAMLFSCWSSSNAKEFYDYTTPFGVGSWASGALPQAMSFDKISAVWSVDGANVFKNAVSCPSQTPVIANICPAPLVYNYCAAGTFWNTTLVACQACNVGTSSNSVGAVGGCTPCAVGKYQNLTGQTSCISCGVSGPPNSIAANLGTVNCVPCGAGTVVSAGYGLCIPSIYSQYLSCPATLSVSTTVSQTISHVCVNTKVQDVAYDACNGRIFISCYGLGLYYAYVHPVTGAAATAFTLLPNTGGIQQSDGQEQTDIDPVNGILYTTSQDSTGCVQGLNLTALTVNPSTPVSFTVLSNSVCSSSVAVYYDFINNILYALINLSGTNKLVSIANPVLGTSATRQTLTLTCDTARTFEVYAGGTLMLVNCEGAGGATSQLQLISLDTVGGMTLQTAFSAQAAGGGSNCNQLSGFYLYGQATANGPNTLQLLCLDSGTGVHMMYGTLTGNTAATATLAVSSSGALSQSCSYYSAGYSMLGRYYPTTSLSLATCAASGSTAEVWDYTLSSGVGSWKSGAYAGPASFDRLGKVISADSSNVYVNLATCSGGANPNQAQMCPNQQIIYNYCAAGTFWNSTAMACQNCPLGTAYGSTGAVGGCTACSPGYFQNQTGQSSCQQCTYGTASTATGLGTACPACAVGTFGNATGLLTCYTCPAGTSSLNGAQSCTACAGGTYSGGNGLCLSCLNTTALPSNPLWVAACSQFSPYMTCRYGVSVSSTISSTISHSCGTAGADIIHDTCYSTLFLACAGTGIQWMTVAPVSGTSKTAWTTINNLGGTNRFPNTQKLELDQPHGLLYAADYSTGVQALNLTQLYFSPFAPTWFNVLPIGTCTKPVDLEYDYFNDILYVACGPVATPTASVYSIRHPSLGAGATIQSTAGNCFQAQSLELYATNSLLLLGCTSTSGGSKHLFLIALDGSGGMNQLTGFDFTALGGGSDCLGNSGWSLYGAVSAAGPNSINIDCGDSGGNHHQYRGVLTGSSSVATLSLSQTGLDGASCVNNAFGRFYQGIFGMMFTCQSSSNTNEFYANTYNSGEVAWRNGQTPSVMSFDLFNQIWSVDSPSVYMNQVSCPGYSVNPAPICPLGKTFYNNCSAGLFWNSSAYICQNCTAGSYSAAGAQSCTLCPAGTYGTVVAGTSQSQACSSCTQGSIAPSAGSTSCTSCGTGSFSNTSTPTVCYQCNPGYAQGSQIAASCSICAPGTFAQNPGAATCQVCRAGQVAPSYGSTSCTSCPYLSSTTDNINCIAQYNPYNTTHLSCASTLQISPSYMKTIHPGQACGSPNDIAYDPCSSILFVACANAAIRYMRISPFTATPTTGLVVFPITSSFPVALELDTLHGLLYIADNGIGLSVIDVTALANGTNRSGTMIFGAGGCAPSYTSLDYFNNILYVLCGNGGPGGTPFMVNVLNPHLFFSGGHTNVPFAGPVCTYGTSLSVYNYGQNVAVSCLAGAGSQDNNVMYTFSSNFDGTLTQLNDITSTTVTGSDASTCGQNIQAMTYSNGLGQFVMACTDQVNPFTTDLGVLTGSNSLAVSPWAASPCGSGGSTYVTHMRNYESSELLIGSCGSPSNSVGFWAFSGNSVLASYTTGFTTASFVYNIWFDQIGKLFAIDAADTIYIVSVSCPGVTPNVSAVCPSTPLAATMPTSCSPGFYLNYDQVTCSPCAAGFYNANTTATVCTACAAGTFTNVTGQTACANCTAGSFQTTAGKTTCTLCTAGHASSIVASTSNTCATCSAGSFAAGTGQTVCTQCLAGQFQNATAATSCAPCQLGSYSGSPGSGYCPQCQPGSFSNTSLATFCYSCPAGSAQPLANQTSCTACSAGSFSAAQAPSCTQCGGGQFSNASQSSFCYSCSAGYYATGLGNTVCGTCPIGNYSAGQASLCTPCPAGTQGVVAGQANACPNCAAGSFSNTSASLNCYLCPSGTFSMLPGASSCTVCSSGTFSNTTGETSCYPCVPGSYAPTQDETTCLLCQPGSYTNTTNQNNCTLCAAGYQAPSQASTGCSACVIGSYTPQAGVGSCIPCQKGMFGNSSAASQCFPCNAGYYTDSTGQVNCLSCNQGSFNNASGSSTCTLCGMGYMAASNASTQCTACSAGSAQGSAGASTCPQCASGQFSNSSAASFCYTCQPGYVTPSGAGSTSCTACAAGSIPSSTSACQSCQSGTYAPTSASTVCQTCPAGSFSNITTACYICPAGSVSANNNSTSCTVCSSGSIAATNGLTQCTTCSAGSYASSNTQCTACMAGQFAGSSGQTSCPNCPSGQFSNSSSATFCYTCPTGYVTPGGQGSTSCVGCSAGYAPNSTSSCSICPAGSFSPSIASASCTQCSPGQFSNASGSTFCYSCSAGQNSGTGATSCGSCTAGTFQNGTQCSPCSAGSYSQIGASQCTQCPVGQFSNSSQATFCYTCTAGSSSSQGSTSCAACSAGSYSTAGTACNPCQAGSITASSGLSSCTSCSVGTVANDTGLSVCSQCSAGSYSTASSYCSVCLPGSFSSAPGWTACAPCPAGSIAPSQSATQCSVCSAGTYSQSTTQCTTCQAGYFSSSNASSCTQCPAGSYSNSSNSAMCTQCPQNTFSAAPGSTNCTTCPGGTLNSGPGSTGCSNCGAGYFQNATLGSCQLCPAGSYSNTNGALNCTTCDAGSFAATAGSSICAQCASGSVAQSGSSSCTACTPTTFAYQGAICASCPGGYFSNVSSATACVQCPPGSYSQGAASSCSLCNPGSFSPFNGTVSSFCFSCPKGYFTNASGASICSACAAGSFANSVGSTGCTVCAAGSYAPTNATINCLSCAVGTFTNSTNSTTCSPCQAGTIAPNQGQLACSVCPGGTAPNNVSTACLTCPAGTSAVNGSALCGPCSSPLTAVSPGQSSCLPCPLGQFWASSSSCSPCAPGSYSNNSLGATICQQCQPGTAQFNSGSLVCPPCAPNSFSNASGLQHCYLCPPGQAQPSTGLTSCSACGLGTFGATSGAACQACPAGTVANSTGLTACISCGGQGWFSDPTRSFCIPPPPNNGCATPTVFNVTNQDTSGFLFMPGDGVTLNPSLVLVQGVTYTFNDLTTAHPFWIRRLIETGTADGLSPPEVVGNGAISPNSVTYTPNVTNVTSVTFYNCQFHPAMHGILYTVANLCPPATAPPTPGPPTTVGPTTPNPTTPPPVATFSIPDNATAIEVGFVFVASDATAAQLASGNTTTIAAIVLELTEAIAQSLGVPVSSITNISLVNASNGVRLFSHKSFRVMDSSSSSSSYSFLFAFTVAGSNLTQAISNLQASVSNSSSVFYTTLSNAGTPLNIDSGALAQITQVTIYPTTPAPSSSSSWLTQWVLIGIAVAGTLLFVLVVIGLFMWCAWCRAHQGMMSVDTNDGDAGLPGFGEGLGKLFAYD